MQLIYLYIDNYNNIKKQGFSFSPEFTCNFEDNILKIDKNPNYVNIFPDNINITALVGKNGSGKSTIFKFILMLIFFNKYKKLDKKDYEHTEEYDIFLKKEYIQSSNIGKDGNRGFLIIKKGKYFYKLTIMVDNLFNIYQTINDSKRDLQDFVFEDTKNILSEKNLLIYLLEQLKNERIANANNPHS